MSQMLHNPYDLIIIKENVIPQENIEDIMLLTNNTTRYFSCHYY